MTQKMTIPPEFEGEYTIRVINMPLTSPGFVMYDDEDHANVYLNARYNRETNENTADHELTHIINDDIHNDDPIEVIESRADAHANPRHSLPPLFKASDLLLPSQSLPQAAEPPVQGKVPAKQAEEVVPHNPIPNPAPQLSPHQAAVLLRAISDLDDWLFNPRYDF